MTAWSDRNTAFVADVQRHLGLPADGKAGAKTVAAWERLIAAPPPVAPPETSPTPAAAGLVYRSREQWVADPSLPRLGHHVDPSRRTEVFIHHTVTRAPGDTPSVWETWDEIVAHMRRLQRIRPDLGLDVPYTAVAHITPTGAVFLCEGRGLHRTGAHTANRNTQALGFAFAGDFESHPPPPELLDRALLAFGAFLRTLKATGGFPRLGSSRPPRGGALWAHQDIKATACPGRHILERLHSIEL